MVMKKKMWESRERIKEERDNFDGENE